MRDAIKYTFDKTIEGMNKGLTPDELVEYAALPDHLASHPNLVQYYGRQEWAIRNIFNGYLGWFDGNATSLRPLSPAVEAEKFAKAVGGVYKLEILAKTALTEKDYQYVSNAIYIKTPRITPHQILIIFRNTANWVGFHYKDMNNIYKSTICYPVSFSATIKSNLVSLF